MKRIMFALCFVWGGFVVVEAQDTTSYDYRTETQSQYPGQGNNQDYSGQSGQQQDRERISATELPEAVKEQLQTQEYSGWLISGAFKYTGDQETGANAETMPGQQGQANNRGGEDQGVYIVELKNGAQTQTLWFDRNGQEIQGSKDESGMDNQHQSGRAQQTQPGQQSDQYNQQQSGQYNQQEESYDQSRYNRDMQDTASSQGYRQQNQQDPRFDDATTPGIEQNPDNQYQPGQPDRSTQGTSRDEGRDQSSQYPSDRRDAQGQTDPTIESGTPDRDSQSPGTGTNTETP